jgi:hypothetical protein
MNVNLNQFGADFIEETRDTVLEQYLAIRAGEMRSENAQAMFKTLSSFTNAQRAQIDSIVVDIIHRTMHKVLYLFEASDDWAIVDKGSAQHAGLKHLAETSDGLSGELYGEAGWIEKFSKFKADSITEK